MGSASDRQEARRRLRTIQVRQREIVRAYERAVIAAAVAEQEHEDAVARAAAAREVARQRRSLALAAVAAAIRDEETTAEIAGVPVREVRAAAREFDRAAVDRFLAELGGEVRRTGRGGAPRKRASDDGEPPSTAAA